MCWRTPFWSGHKDPGPKRTAARNDRHSSRFDATVVRKKHRPRQLLWAGAAGADLVRSDILDCHTDVATDEVREASRARAPDSPVPGEDRDIRTARTDEERCASGPPSSSEHKDVRTARPDEECDFYFLQQIRSVERSVREVVEGEGPYISRQIVAMSSRRCSSLSGSTSCWVSLITTLESFSG